MAGRFVPVGAVDQYSSAFRDGCWPPLSEAVATYYFKSHLRAELVSGERVDFKLGFYVVHLGCSCWKCSF